MKLSILVGELTSWPSFFCMSKDHAQLLIMHAYIRNGKGTASMIDTVASERGGTEALPVFDCYCTHRWSTPPTSTCM